MIMPNSQSMAENFQQFFSVQFATTNEQVKIAQHLRYRVYCEEFGYEKSGGFIDQNEADEFDHQSTHCLIVHNETRQAAGCVRVVPAVNAKERNILPLEKHCGDALHPAYLRKLNQERATNCEISRLAVDSDFRRRSIKEKESRFGRVTKIDLSPTEIRTLHLIRTQSIGQKSLHSPSFKWSIV